VVSFSSDWLYPDEQAQELCGALLSLGRDVEYYHVQAPFGHDSFLVEVDRMTHLVGDYLDRHWKRHAHVEKER
jgi:homoserine O-acetyltransferase/O-succinyltransferase